MKKLLLGTSAMVAAGLLSTGAMAQGFTVSTGGTFAVGFGIVSQDDGVGQPGAGFRDHAFAQSSEIIFRADATLDNGTRVRAQVELEGETTGDQIDENFIRFSNDAYGTLELGGNDGASGAMFTLAPAVDFNNIVGVPEFSYVAFPGANKAIIALGLPFFISARQNDSLKVTYFSPRLGGDGQGVQFGISYEPDPGTDGATPPAFSIRGTVAPDSSTTGATSEYIEAGINYVGNFGDVSFRGGVVYSKGSQESAGVLFDDDELWHVGVQLGFGAFAFGGAFQSTQANHNTLAPDADDESFRISGTYAMGPWLFGAAYAQREVDDRDVGAVVGVNGQDEANVWGVTAKRTLGPGVTVSAGVRVWDIKDDDNAPANQDDATVVFFTTRADF